MIFHPSIFHSSIVVFSSGLETLQDLNFNSHLFRCKPELIIQNLCRGGITKMIQSENFAFWPNQSFKINRKACG